MTGLLLTWFEPVRLHMSPTFWVKGTLRVHALVFRGGVYRHPKKLDARITSQAKLTAVLSVVLWAGIVLSGRRIAFDPSFDE